MPVRILPDVERAVALFLANAAELAQLVAAGASRVYTVTPREVGGDPFLLVRRFTGAPTVPRPFVHELVTLQIDSYGGTRATAQRNARIVQQLLVELAGELDDGETPGWVTGTTLGPLRWIPDEAFDPARPRYVLDVDVLVKRARSAVPIGARDSAAVTAGGTVRQSTD